MSNQDRSEYSVLMHLLVISACIVGYGFVLVVEWMTK